MYSGRQSHTLEAVQWFFEMGCPLVILACNTASAKALRTIQQNDLPKIAPEKRVLGVIRPTAEVIGKYTKTGHVGVLATSGTVQSGSYEIEIKKLYPELNVFQEACPMWVPLVENNEHLGPGADYFVKKNINNLFFQSLNIDTVLLACTHYPLMQSKIAAFVPAHINIISQGKIVAKSLADYLLRHPEIAHKCTKNGTRTYYTTDDTAHFDNHAGLFFGETVHSMHLDLDKKR